MENKAKLGFILSLLGVWILLLISTSISPKELTIENITNQTLNKKVVVYGNITNVKTFENSTFQLITLKDPTGKITVTAFSENKVLKEDNVLVIGKVEVYNSTLQIVADKILS